MLNGAPLCEQLDFSDSTLLPAEDCPPFDVSAAVPVLAEESTQALKWRYLSTKNTRLRTGWSQPHLTESTMDQNMLDMSLPSVYRFTSFLQEDTTNFDTAMSFNSPPDATTDFLDHSLIFHDTLLSSQIADNGPERTISSSSFLTTSFGTTASELSSPSKINEHTLVHQVPSKIAITSLGSLPSAERLLAMYPQTPTPSFVCVLTANAEQREVFVRKGEYKMNLWEIIVADDTHSGFKVTFWLRPPSESSIKRKYPQDALLQNLHDIRVGDVLLLRNIALRPFRNEVFGQSLHPNITRARTSIDVLMRSSGVSVAQLGGLPVSVTERFIKVKRWARTYIASDTAGSKKRKKGTTNNDNLANWSISAHNLDDSMPPDTMETV
ncbi:Nucleic acid-binding OB-fold [Pyrenophora seminiperda CCB06]|uniref:Nucleic acid-binding OB-fold n=1 Tax=Pyrenophora seminiperda CCB06 TaxID=1302712 RepID=A0A3M7MJJ3_9PLEO|nr:Nucleic acid-binding OB-fold [Pyrenophora seminiperda CCB06]